jgi:DNA-binding MarR family transcriptional regulator
MRVINPLLGRFDVPKVTPMDTIPTSRADLRYSDKPPILICASSESALARAVETVEASGARIADRVAIDDAHDRIARQVSASAVWVELDRDCGATMDRLLSEISEGAADGRYAAVVSSTAALIDPVTAGLQDGAVELIVDAGDAERAAALAIAEARTRRDVGRLSDIASDQNAARLRQLSDEVSRIAATLARLSSAPPVSGSPAQVSRSKEPPQISAETVRAVIRARRLRTRYFADDLFADPAWDMLLDLLQAEIAQLRVPVSSLCIAAAVPATTALRWLKTMVQEGLFIRRADPQDGRRVFVELAPDASRALRSYFAEVGQVAVI